MKSELIDNIITLRAAVSFLGEKMSWWDTDFYQSSSQEFLDYIFPKSFNTQFLSACVSIRSFIDNEVGANYYHLFRLPVILEELISNVTKVSDVNLFKYEEEALYTLKVLALNLSSDGNKGPKNIGSVDQFNEDLVQVFSIEYLTAFENNYIVHPYLN